MESRIFFLAVVLVMVQGFARDPQTCLWYRRPAKKWEEALPVGNGRLGAMVHGGLRKEVIQLNEDSMWSGKPHDWNNLEFYEGQQEVKKLLKDGEYVKAHEIAEKKLICRGDGSHYCNTAKCDYGSYQTLGDLTFAFQHEGEVTDYVRELDLKTAVASVAYKVDGVEFRRNVFSSFPDQAIVIQLTASQEHALNFDVAINRSENGCVSVSDDAVLSMTGNLYRDGIDYAAAAQVICANGSTEVSDKAIQVRDATDVTIVVVAQTTFREKEPQKRNQSDLDKLRKHTFEQLQTRHVEDYSKLFNRCLLNLDTSPISKQSTAGRLWSFREGGFDPGIFALYFNYGRYLLLASSRGQSLPANLQGIWSSQILTPWCGDFHLNINLQMNYWPAEVANLSECSEPLDDFIFRLERTGTETARQMYRARGWVAHHISNVWGFSAPAEHPSWGLFPGGAAWLCRHLWEKYQYSRDKAYLVKVYPTLVNAALFYLDTLHEEGQHLLPPVSNSPENVYTLKYNQTGYLSKAATVQLTLVRDIMTIVKRASHILNRDEDLRAQLEKALSKLYPYQIDDEGLLKEYSENYSLPFSGHRHMSHLIGVYPGYDTKIWTNQDLLEAAKRSVITRWKKGVGQTGWNLGWTINLFARLGEQEFAYDALKTMLGCSTLPNFFDTHPPFQIDGNFGGVAGIAEMLLQSHGDEIMLLPALPKAWKNGTIKGLRARGGLIVSMQWENAQIVNLELEATTKNTFNIRLPKGHMLRQVVVNGEQKDAIEIKGREMTCFELTKGDCIAAF